MECKIESHITAIITCNDLKNMRNMIILIQYGEVCAKEDLLYKCMWSPLEGMTFHSRVEKTFVNGEIAYDCNNRDLCFHNTPMSLVYNK